MSLTKRNELIKKIKPHKIECVKESLTVMKKELSVFMKKH